MYTIAETLLFEKLSRDVWNEDERQVFFDWLARNPEGGDVIQGTRGLRKVRWGRSGMGKRGGARVIYYNMLDNGKICLLMIYTKTKFDNLPVTFLNQLKEEVLK